MPYWRHFYHLVWATRNREPLIGPAEEEVLLRSFEATCEKSKIISHAVGIVPDHVHLVVSIPPALAVSDAVHGLKGASSHEVNVRLASPTHEKFSWQREYGSLTLGERSLPMVIDYVLNQKQHHADGTLKTSFERILTTE